MYVETVPNRHSPPAILLREAWREDGRIRKRTVANLSHWPPPRIDALRRLLRDDPLVAPGELFTIERSVPHGHVDAILTRVRTLGLDTLIATKRSRPRDLVLALIVERLIHPCSKLATTRLWSTTTLGETLGVTDADVDEVYDALDWLVARQSRIEQKLAARHLGEGAVALYDVSSSYYEGHTCPLARFGHDRDGHTGRPIIVYGVMTDTAGRPMMVDVYPGNTGDPTTVADQVERLQSQFGITRVTLVGDRGLLTQTQIKQLRAHPGLGWISALRSPAIRALDCRFIPDEAEGRIQLHAIGERDADASRAANVFPISHGVEPIIEQRVRGMIRVVAAAAKPERMIGISEDTAAHRDRRPREVEAILHAGVDLADVAYEEVRGREPGARIDEIDDEEVARDAL